VTSDRASIRELVLPLLEAGGTAPIVQLGHPALRRPARPFDGQLDPAELAALLELMRRTMHAAPGVGLAAPQLGIPLRIAVLEDRFAGDPAIAAVRERTPLPYFAILNPSYTSTGPETALFYEGCLSFAGFHGVVERHRTVRLDFQRPDGSHAAEDFTGWPARIVQHETDHLNGTLYVDKVLTRSLAGDAEYQDRWSEPGIGRARAGLGF
jgi:peptide deformylase